ncbi:uncharacterized protein LOC144994235 [Oryzias latipes]
MKDALLSKFMDVSFAQSKRLSCLSAALQDTAPWDPSTCERPSSSSTLKQRSLNEEVVVRRPRKSSDETRRRTPVLSLFNRFASLAADSPAPSSATTAAQTPPDLGSTPLFPRSLERRHGGPGGGRTHRGMQQPGSGLEDHRESSIIRIRRASGTPRVLAGSSIFLPPSDPEGSRPLPFQQVPGLAAADGPPAAS